MKEKKGIELVKKTEANIDRYSEETIFEDKGMKECWINKIFLMKMK